MLSDLAPYLSRPALYERTDALFWDDPHIARQMLAAHLDPGTDAASRSPQFMDRSAAWIAGLLPTGGHILDLGCGPGLYGRRFGDLGLQVTGIDLSAGSVEYARSHDPAGDYRVGNYLDCDLAGPYDAVCIIWCDYGALTPSGRKALLGRVHQVLVPGGALILDVYAASWLERQPRGATWEWCADGGFFSAAPHLLMHSAWHYGERIRLERHVVVGDEAIRDYNVWNTTFDDAELRAELSDAGFADAALYGDLAGAPRTTSSNLIAAVARLTR